MVRTVRFDLDELPQIGEAYGQGVGERMPLQLAVDAIAEDPSQPRLGVRDGSHTWGEDLKPSAVSAMVEEGIAPEVRIAGPAPQESGRMADRRSRLSRNASQCACGNFSDCHPLRSTT